MDDGSFRNRVLIELEPERVQIVGDVNVDDLSLKDELSRLVDLGLRAVLVPGSLITGQMYVSLEMSPADPIRIVSDQSEYQELPTILSTLEYVSVVSKDILAEIDKVAVDQIGNEALGLIQGANHLMNNPDLLTSVTEFRKSLQSFAAIMKAFEGNADPMFADLAEALNSGKDVLKKSGSTMDMIQQLMKPESPFQYEFNKLTRELSETAKTIRTFVDMMERYPNSVIFGKPEAKE